MTNNSSSLGKRVVSLIRKLEANTSESRKIKSYLKRSPVELSNAPDLWEFIYRGSNEEDTLNDKDYQAIYTALRFFAFHSGGSEKAHKSNADGGSDIAGLLASYRKSKRGQNIDPKFSAILTSTDPIRLIRLLEPLFERAVKEVSVSVDYVNFAYQLKSIQYPTSIKKVLLNWGKNYYKSTPEKTEIKETK